MLFSRGRGLIRTLIRDDLSGLDRHGRWTRATRDRPQSRPPLFFLLLPLTRDNQFDGNLPAGENTVGGRSSLSDGN